MRLLFSLAILVSCCPKRPPVNVTVTERGCLEIVGTRPKLIGYGAVTHKTDPECPEKFDHCVSPEAAARLEINLRRLSRWVNDAMVACSKTSEGDTDDD